MTDDWLEGDPFAEGDPAAAERERRRREREERRRARGGQAEPEGPRRPPPGGPEPRSEPAQAPRQPGAGEPAQAPRQPGSGEPAQGPRQPPRSEPTLRREAGPHAEAAVPSEPPAARPPKAPQGGHRRSPPSRGRIFAILGVLVALAAAIVAGAEAYRHFHNPEPPPLALKTTTVTIPEGYSRPQTAALAREDGLRGDYVKASIHSRYLNPAKYGGAGAKDLEGFLFPDTFELERAAPVADLVQLQLEDFKRRIAGVDMGYARSKNLTTFDVLTIASMIEKEAEVEKERPLIAAVIYNRLHEGMPLGIDATTRFATGNYTKPLTESELAIESPYNTRVNSGLPPGPISNPGLASIEAAAHPAKVDYLFYVAKPGTCGEHAFSSNEAQFNEDVARYEEAREAAGGESPDTCP